MTRTASRSVSHRAALALALLLSVMAPAACGAQRPGGSDSVHRAPVPAAPAPGEAANEAAFLSNVRQLTVEGRRAGEGYFNPDGTKLVFQSEREEGNPFFQIYVLDLETGDTTRVSPGTGKTTCAFIQAGTGRVLFASTHLDPEAVAKQEEEYALRASGKARRYSWDYDEHFDIFVADEDGANIVRLTDARGYDAEGSFSPDGATIVFSSNRAAYTEELTDAQRKRREIDKAYFADLYVMDADGGNLRRLTHEPGYDGGPFFTPDGTRIIWRHFDEEGLLADVYTIRPDGTDKRRLTDFGAMSWAPYMHVSGEYAIFASNKHGFENFELFLVDAAGEREPVRVTWTAGFDGLPVFSPDGARLAWTTNRTSDETSQLFMADWNHEAAMAALGKAAPRATSTGDDADGTAAAVAANAVSAATGYKPIEPATSPGTTPKERLRKHVGYLADDALEGRMTGSAGEMLAAEYLIAHLKRLGLEPFDHDGDYLEPFEFVAGTKLGDHNAATTRIVGPPRDPRATQAHPHAADPHAPPPAEPEGPVVESELTVGKDFTPLAFSTSGELTAPVVFAGYGITVKGEQPYDSFEGLEVADRWVLAFLYAPENTSGEERRRLFRYAGLRYKAMMARERGAKGLLVVHGPNSPGEDKLMRLQGDAGGSDSGLAAMQVRREVADAMLAQAGTTLAEMQSALDGGAPVPGFELPGVTFSATIDLSLDKGTGHNILAVIPPVGGRHDDTMYYLVGAHYDHLGHGLGNQSLGRGDERGQIHNGADDNASGTAAVLETAEQIMQKGRHNLRNGLVFCFWSGEELGLVGSYAFLANPPVKHDRLLGYLNMDMVGRMRDNVLSVEGMGSSTAWKKLVERGNIAAGFRLALSDDPYVPTDAMAFYINKIPVLALFTGTHDDYHRPTDDSERINYDGAERVVRMATNIARALASEPKGIDYVAIERPAMADLASRAAIRVTLGTIPDYTSPDVKGVRLSGVRAGSPAEQAGVMGGDLVVKLAGQQITNIYDYTFAIETLRANEEIEMVVVRGGEETALKITPAAR